jgi:hypothetical protein
MTAAMTTLIAVATGVYVYFSFGLWQQTQEDIELTRESVELAKDSTEISLKHLR